MAYKKKSTPKSKDDGAEKGARNEKKELLLKGRKCFKLASEADATNRTKAEEDIRFVNVPGAQWDTNMTKRRGKRPAYEFNKLRINGKRVINEIRANRPQIKVRATEDGDKDTADIYEGLIRNIWATSDGDTIIDHAAEYQVDGGMTAWRVVTKYSDDTMFDQDIMLEGFKNPFCVYADPNCKDPIKRDADYWFVTDRMSNDAFDARWPKKERVTFEMEDSGDEEDWQTEETTRVCEYWYKEPYTKDLWLVKTPKGNLTVDSTEDEAEGVLQKIEAKEYELIKTRSVKCHRIMMCIMSGSSILEGPVEWAGSMFPFVMVYGEHKVVDGEFLWWGLHRFAKDSQRSYNVSRTAIDETIAQAPKAKFWASPAMAAGNANQWAQAHDENLPVLIANDDPKFPGKFPERMGGADVPVALMQQAEIASADIRDVTGLHEASFGEESQEKSGIALARKQNQAQIVTYNFPDNIAKGIRRTGEILIDLIPGIYDSERELRILGADGAEDYAKVNELVPTVDPETGETTPVRVNDLSKGKYDLTVTVGPSFSTLRQEAVEVYGQLFPPESPMYPFVADLIAKSMDYPYSDEVAERLLLAAPPQVQQSLAEGKKLPPEVQAAQAQIQQKEAQLAEVGQMVQAAAQEAEQKKAEAEKAEAQVKTAQAELKTQMAEFKAQVAETQTKLVQQGAQLDTQHQQLNNDRQAFEGEKQITEMQGQQNDAITQQLQSAQEAVSQIDEMAAKFMQAAGAMLQEMQAMLAEVKSKPRVKSVRSERDKTSGALIAIPEYEVQ